MLTCIYMYLCMLPTAPLLTGSQLITDCGAFVMMIVSPPWSACGGPALAYYPPSKLNSSHFDVLYTDHVHKSDIMEGKLDNVQQHVIL